MVAPAHQHRDHHDRRRHDGELHHAAQVGVRAPARHAVLQRGRVREPDVDDCRFEKNTWSMNADQAPVATRITITGSR